MQGNNDGAMTNRIGTTVIRDGTVADSTIRDGSVADSTIRDKSVADSTIRNGSMKIQQFGMDLW